MSRFTENLHKIVKFKDPAVCRKLLAIRGSDEKSFENCIAYIANETPAHYVIELTEPILKSRGVNGFKQNASMIVKKSVVIVTTEIIMPTVSKFPHTFKQASEYIDKIFTTDFSSQEPKAFTGRIARRQTITNQLTPYETLLWIQQ